MVGLVNLLLSPVIDGGGKRLISRGLTVLRREIYTYSHTSMMFVVIDYLPHLNLIKKMPGALWRTDEIIVLVYFQLWKVCHEACRRLIERKCGTQRDLAGIQGKLAHI